MSCEHSDLSFVRTPEMKHYGKEICTFCGRFMRWVAKPETQERQSENGRKIVYLRNLDLGKWANEFIASLDGQGPKLSPKQQAKLDELWEANKP